MATSVKESRIKTKDYSQTDKSVLLLPQVFICVIVEAVLDGLENIMGKGKNTGS